MGKIILSETRLWWSFVSVEEIYTESITMDFVETNLRVEGDVGSHESLMIFFLIKNLVGFVRWWWKNG